MPSSAGKNQFNLALDPETVRDYADGLFGNEKNSRQLESEKRMAGMSDKFKEIGGKISLSASDEKREPID